jgi:hypothetical protein
MTLTEKRRRPRYPSDSTECRKIYYLKNRDIIRAKSKKYYEDNKVAVSKQRKGYRQKHSIRITQYRKCYDATHKQAIKQWAKEFFQNNKDKFRRWAKNRILKAGICITCHKTEKIYCKGQCKPCYFKARGYIWGKLNSEKLRVYRCNRRTRARGLKVETVQRVYEDNIKRYGTLTCYLCIKPIEFGKDHLEHKTPLVRGGTNEYDNLGVACSKCNCSKGRKTVEEFSAKQEIRNRVKENR